jgi:hypothetical protein
MSQQGRAQLVETYVNEINQSCEVFVKERRKELKSALVYYVEINNEAVKEAISNWIDKDKKRVRVPGVQYLVEQVARPCQV